MLEQILAIGTLVLYHQQAALVQSVGQKIEIILKDGRIKSVRPKDVLFLHSGPVAKLSQVLDNTPLADIEEAWELLVDEDTLKYSLTDLCSLIYGEITPQAIWASYQLLNQTPYFKGSPAEVIVRKREDVEREAAAKRYQEQQQRLWEGVIERLEKNCLNKEDRQYFEDVERLAQGELCKPIALKLLSIAATAEDAHSFLLKHGLWTELDNPHPARNQVPLKPFHYAENGFTLPDEERLDLTDLTSWAIDDENSIDPDDAISLDGDDLWVHIADVAAIIRSDSALDILAKERASTLYLPEGDTPMLPFKLIERLGLGLASTSPALSFRLRVAGNDDELRYTLLEYRPSWVRVKRLSYARVEQLLLARDPDFIYLQQLMTNFANHRGSAGAVSFQFPDIKLKIVAGAVELGCGLIGAARQLVSEAMILVGYGVAGFCHTHNIPIPYVQQSAPQEKVGEVETLLQAFSARRKMSPGLTKSTAGRHFGLGLDYYTRATSPLRRYLDLVLHQQLRHYYDATPLLNEEQILERIASAEAVNGRLRTAMRSSHRHWLLVYLQQQNRKEWQAVLLEKRDRRGLMYLAEIGLEIWLPIRTELKLGQQVALVWQSVNLARSEAVFKVA